MFDAQEHDQGLDPGPRLGRVCALPAQDACGSERGERALAGPARRLEHEERRSVVVVLDLLLREPDVVPCASDPAAHHRRGERQRVAQIPPVDRQVVQDLAARRRLGAGASLPVVLDPVQVAVKPARCADDLVPVELRSEARLERAQRPLDVERDPARPAGRFVDRAAEGLEVAELERDDRRPRQVGPEDRPAHEAVRHGVADRHQPVPR